MRAKYFGADAAFRACDRAVRTHGGMGYASEYNVERYFREAVATRLAPNRRADPLLSGRARARPAALVLTPAMRLIEADGKMLLSGAGCRWCRGASMARTSRSGPRPAAPRSKRRCSPARVATRACPARGLLRRPRGRRRDHRADAGRCARPAHPGRRKNRLRVRMLPRLADRRRAAGAGHAVLDPGGGIEIEAHARDLHEFVGTLCGRCIPTICCCFLLEAGRKPPRLGRARPLRGRALPAVRRRGCRAPRDQSACRPGERPSPRSTPSSCSTTTPASAIATGTSFSRRGSSAPP